MGAREPHIAKYVFQYRALYPTSPILLVRSEPRHFIRPRGAPRELGEPAVPVVRSVFPELGNPSPPLPNGKSSPETEEEEDPVLLLHAFSNGGVSSLQTLRRALLSSSTTPGSLLPLPRYALILDSCPGQFHYRSGYLAFTAGLSGPALWFIAPLMHALCAWNWLLHVLIGKGRTGPLAVLARGLNYPGGDGSPSDWEARKRHREREVRRTYVYSMEDKLVGGKDVEAHAEEAEGQGFRVRRERFVGSEHVAHARRDPARYWGVVKATWEGVGW